MANIETVYDMVKRGDPMVCVDVDDNGNSAVVAGVKHDDGVITIHSVQVGAHVAIPKYLWEYETGTNLTGGENGQLKVAEPGDWVVATLVNEGLSRYAVIVMPYKMGNDIGEGIKYGELRGPYLKDATVDELLEELRVRCGE